jgi:hypothetical protein
MNYKKLPIESIAVSPFKDRFSHETPVLMDNERLEDIPVIVAQSKETGKYIVLKQVSVFVILKSKGAETILCKVQSTVDSDADAYALRTAYVLEERLPFHILEQCLCVHQCTETALQQDGEKAFYCNGGDRRSKDFKKVSILEKVSNLMPYKKQRIDMLKRFGCTIGKIGIEGLHQVLAEKGDNLGIGKIHSKNSKIKSANIISQIKSLKEQGKSQEEVKPIIGMEIYAILFDTEIAGENEVGGYQPEDEEDDDDEAEAEPETPSINPTPGPISEADTNKIKSDLDKCLGNLLAVQNFLTEKKSISAEEGAALGDHLKKIQKSITQFFLDCHRDTGKRDTP